MKEIDASEIRRLRSLHYEIHRHFYISLIISSGGWLPYFPLLMAWEFISQSGASFMEIYSKIKEAIKSMLYLDRRKYA